MVYVNRRWKNIQLFYNNISAESIMSIWDCAGLFGLRYDCDTYQFIKTVRVPKFGEECRPQK
jgi:hypothetical protein